MKRLLAPTLLLFLIPSLYAQDPEKVATQTRIEKQSATINGDRGLFTVPSVETLNKKQFSFGAAWNNFDRTPGDLDINAFSVSLAYGLFGRLTVMATVDAQRQIKASSLAQQGFNTNFPFVKDSFVKGIGDSYFGAKYRLQRKKDNIGGIALKGFVKVATAKADKGLGTGELDGGVELIFTSALPLGFLMHSSMGFIATRDATKPSAKGLKDEGRSGLGLVWPSTGIRTPMGRLQGIFEYATGLFVGAGSANAATAKIQNPSDLNGGLRFIGLNSGITVSAGYRVNRSFDFSFPGNKDNRGVVFGISYTKPVQIVIAGNNHYPVLAIESDTTEVQAGGSVSLTATGFDADNDTLTYAWTVSGGRVEGSGEKVTFRTAGLTPGKYVVHATVSDGRGGVSETTVEITVRQ